MYEHLATDVPGFRLNGHPTERLPNTLNIGFPGVLAADLLASTPEVAASPGSACHAELCEISHVLKAMGVEEDFAIGSIRISLGKWSTDDEADTIVDLLSARYESLLEGRNHQSIG
jgi:cysteine desulfurase